PDMRVGDVTVSDIERLEAVRAEDYAFEMDEEAFRSFYDRTARPLWAYLSRLAADPAQADDLLQETYYRFLRAKAQHENEAHRRHSLFRIATNLARDAHRRRRADPLRHAEDAAAEGMALPEQGPAPDARMHAMAESAHVRHAMARLAPRERAMLWLAYAHGSSHREIAEVVGVKAPSVKQLLFRARRKMAALLKEPS
ncbi:MAG: RNA polymerase sigma factor, partial [Acidobacteriota bacterium]|nr:RNA polymerase sigma factor [Acidobacteriota bacterium]